MLDIADRRFLRGHTTIELMIQAKTKDERYMVAVVSLLEVSEANRYSGMSEWEIEMVKRYHRIVKEYLIGCDRVAVPHVCCMIELVKARDRTTHRARENWQLGRQENLSTPDSRSDVRLGLN